MTCRHGRQWEGADAETPYQTPTPTGDTGRRGRRPLPLARGTRETRRNGGETCGTSKTPSPTAGAGVLRVSKQKRPGGAFLRSGGAQRRTLLKERWRTTSLGHSPTSLAVADGDKKNAPPAGCVFLLGQLTTALYQIFAGQVRSSEVSSVPLSSSTKLSAAAGVAFGSTF